MILEPAPKQIKLPPVVFIGKDVEKVIVLVGTIVVLLILLAEGIIISLISASFLKTAIMVLPSLQF
ncbi:MAG: hypothetical protein Q6367_009470 [Candidatus Freyarchaeota archaeon]